jgi:hypothetical protein
MNSNCLIDESIARGAASKFSQHSIYNAASFSAKGVADRAVDGAAGSPDAANAPYNARSTSAIASQKLSAVREIAATVPVFPVAGCGVDLLCGQSDSITLDVSPRMSRIATALL